MVYPGPPVYYVDGSPMAAAGGYYPPGAAGPPSYAGYDAYGNPQPPPSLGAMYAGAMVGAEAGGGGPVYVGGGAQDGDGDGGGGGGGSKTYINMPRTGTGQRICYYHNVGRCTNTNCPFVHVLVRGSPGSVAGSGMGVWGGRLK